jgi:hypothetical protein
MIKISFIILFSLSWTASFAKDEYLIDWKYHAGEYLIYDCEREHYACVDIDGNANCLEERNFAKEKKFSSLTCAPLKKFKNKKECVEENYKVVDIGAKKRFCYPEIKPGI